jgi:DNA polymerase-4
VIVGGIGLRGVVSTASYEARVFGVGSAMAMSEARRRCPNAAFLGGRFGAYRQASSVVMGLLKELSPRVEPLSLDEAFVDLAAGEPRALDSAALVELAEDLRARLTAATGGLTASVGLGSSKFMAKVASEVATIAGLPARAIPGVGPATMDRLARLGVSTIADLQELSQAEVVRELGKSSGEHLYRLARADDDRPVEPERETKSISIEDTFEHDINDAGVLGRIAERHAASVAERLAKSELFARTVTVKVRWPDFSSISRSRTLNGATDRPEVVAQVARALLDGLDTSQGVRLLGVGVSGLVEVAQEPLFDLEVSAPGRVVEEAEAPLTRRPSGWLAGSDVVHSRLGPGWVWGSGLGRVTVRFETAGTGPGPVRTFATDDPELSPAAPPVPP